LEAAFARLIRKRLALVPMAKPLVLETEFQAMRVRTGMPPALTDHGFEFDTDR